uniref:Uncharacterized protein n=1 Tax=Meloidogyne incognita TaxID=6306 RepID=A0A914MI72_MELIC
MYVHTYNQKLIFIRILINLFHDANEFTEKIGQTIVRFIFNNEHAIIGTYAFKAKDVVKDGNTETDLDKEPYKFEAVNEFSLELSQKNNFFTRLIIAGNEIHNTNNCRNTF